MNCDIRCAHVDGRLQFHRIVGQWVLGVLQVGDHVVRGSAREAFDVRILDDRLVELRERYVDQRKAPASAVHLQMAGSVYCVSPNLWPTWPRVNIQVASLVNQPHGTIRRSRTDGTIPRTPQSHEACVDAARESQASQASPSHDIRPAPLSPPRSSF